LVPFPRSVLTQSCLGALKTIPLTSWLGVFSEVHFTTDGLQSSSTSQGWSMETGCTYYVNVISYFCFLLFINVQKKSKLFVLCHYMVLCVIWGGKRFNQF
jgi:hypothetical protein